MARQFRELTVGALAPVVIAAWVVLAFAGVPRAQADVGAPAPPDTLDESAIRAVLSELDDQQVRALLLERLTREAERQAAAEAISPERRLSDVVGDGAAALGAFFVDVIVKAPRIPGEVVAAFKTFAERRGDAPFWRFLATLAASLGLGAACAYAATRLAPEAATPRTPSDDRGPLDHAGRLAARLALQALCVGVFALIAISVNAWTNATEVADRETIARIVSALTSITLSLVVARFLFAPRRPDLRLCAIDDDEARWLTGRFLLVSVIFYGGFGFTRWLNAFDSVFRDSWHGAWMHLFLHLALGATLWRGRSILRKILRGSAPADAPEPTLHRIWPGVAVGLVASHWLVVEIIVANAYVSEGLWTAMEATLVAMLALPFMDKALSAVIAAKLPDKDTPSEALAAANAQTRRGALRIARVVCGLALLLGLLALWGVDLVTVAERGVGARFGADLVGALTTAALAYIAWEAVRVVVDRQIAFERVALGLDGKAEGETDGEGGGAGARLGTLLPLVRIAANTAIVVFAALTILGNFGVNVLPLLAGAGVVGLAIGFGAQTLVKDIVSGVFFLIDDAFRLGEYIDVGSVKGTVERISVRSMQLRHHRGVLNTVPFGDVGHVANFSRDWVVMKFPLRLPYGTDTEKVRKMIKKLGQELLEHPEYGDQFLQPLKSQGVVEMEDSYMIVPVKFMARPGEQWMLRRLVLTKIHELFEEKGVRFASREVMVRLGDGPASAALGTERREALAGAAARQIQDEEEARQGRAAQ